MKEEEKEKYARLIMSLGLDYLSNKEITWETFVNNLKIISNQLNEIKEN